MESWFEERKSTWEIGGSIVRMESDCSVLDNIRVVYFKYPL